MAVVSKAMLAQEQDRQRGVARSSLIARAASCAASHRVVLIGYWTAGARRRKSHCFAARTRSLACVKLLRGLEPQRFCRVVACCNAEVNGHLPELQRLCSQDSPCPSIERTCECAAQEGKLDVLQWIRSQDQTCHVGSLDHTLGCRE